jgi:hypothetical protein
MTVNPGVSSVDVGAVAPHPFISSYGKRITGNKTMLIYNGGVIGSRGRSQLLTFYLDDVVAEASTIMTFLSTVADMPKGFPVFQGGSLLGLQILKKGGSGTLTVIPQYSTTADLLDPSTAIAAFPTLVINCATTKQASALYTPLQYLIPATYLIGFRCQASADYVAGATPKIVVYALIES